MAKQQFEEPILIVTLMGLPYSVECRESKKIDKNEL